MILMLEYQEMWTHTGPMKCAHARLSIYSLGSLPVRERIKMKGGLPAVFATVTRGKSTGHWGLVDCPYDCQAAAQNSLGAASVGAKRQKASPLRGMSASCAGSMGMVGAMPICRWGRVQRWR